jgi:hypothetical protein
MFEPGKFLKRALQIVWQYKVLWIFGFLLVLTGGAGNSGGGSFGGNASGAEWRTDQPFNYRGADGFGEFSPQMQQVEDWVAEHVAPLFATEAKAIATVFIIVGIIFLIALVFGLLAALVRYPADTAVMRMVDAHEQSGTKLRFKEGWRLGWNRRAWRIFLVDLLIGTPAFGIVLLLVGGLGAYFFANRENPEAALNVGVGIWIVLVVLLMLTLALLLVVVGLVRQFIIRKAAFEELGVRESFRQGWAMFKLNWKHAALMWLIMIGIGIGFGIAMFIAAIILIPAYFILALPGVIAAAIPGAIGYGITSLFAGEVLPWIIGALVALPVFIIVVLSPLYLIMGAYTVYSSTIWTLFYREKNLPLVPPTVPTDSTPIPPLPIAEN